MRCYLERNIDKIKKAAMSANLKVETGGYSGAVDTLQRGVGVDGGYLLKNGPNVVGWGCAFSNKEFHIYVIPKFRKLGGASRMVRRAKKEFKDHQFCPWTLKTYNFFTKRKANITFKYY